MTVVGTHVDEAPDPRRPLSASEQRLARRQRRRERQRQNDWQLNPTAPTPYEEWAEVEASYCDKVTTALADQPGLHLTYRHDRRRPAKPITVDDLGLALYAVDVVGKKGIAYGQLEFCLRRWGHSYHRAKCSGKLENPGTMGGRQDKCPLCGFDHPVPLSKGQQKELERRKALEAEAVRTASLREEREAEDLAARPRPLMPSATVPQLSSSEGGYGLAEEMKDCPYCGEEIQFYAKKCKHCGEFLGTTGANSLPISGRRVQQAASGGWSGMAIAGFILSLVPVIPMLGSLLALIFSLVGLSAIRKGIKQRGRGLAVAGVILSLIYLALPPVYFFMVHPYIMAESRKTVCLAKLHAIGSAMLAYNDTASPDSRWNGDPQVLANSKLLGPEGRAMFHCPDDSRSGDVCSYFIHTNVDPHSDPHSLIACDYKDLHPKGRCVLYADSSAIFMAESAFQEELRKPINAEFAAALRRITDTSNPTPSSSSSGIPVAHIDDQTGNTPGKDLAENKGAELQAGNAVTPAPTVTPTPKTLDPVVSFRAYFQKFKKNVAAIPFKPPAGLRYVQLKLDDLNVNKTSNLVKPYVATALVSEAGQRLGWKLVFFMDDDGWNLSAVYGRNPSAPEEFYLIEESAIITQLFAAGASASR